MDGMVVACSLPHGISSDRCHKTGTTLSASPVDHCSIDANLLVILHDSQLVAVAAELCDLVETAAQMKSKFCWIPAHKTVGIGWLERDRPSSDWQMNVIICLIDKVKVI